MADDTLISGAMRSGVNQVATVIRLTVGEATGSVKHFYFIFRSSAFAFLKENYPSATEAISPRDDDLNLFHPVMEMNCYAISEIPLTSTRPPTEHGISDVDRITVAYGCLQERNEIGEVSDDAKLLGIWRDEEEAALYYRLTQPDKFIRNNQILADTATADHPVLENQIYLETVKLIRYSEK